MCIFEGKMDAAFYIRILENYLIPFIDANFRTGHRYMQDNYPKHTSRLVKIFLRILKENAAFIFPSKRHTCVAPFWLPRHGVFGFGFQLWGLVGFSEALSSVALELD